MPLLADDATLDVLGKAVRGIVQQHMAARCPPESPSDVIFSVFNDPRHDPSHPGVGGAVAHTILRPCTSCESADAGRCLPECGESARRLLKFMQDRAWRVYVR